MLMQAKSKKFSHQFNESFKSFCSTGKKYFIVVVAMFMVTINHANAEDVVPNKFRIALGGYAVPGY